MARVLCFGDMHEPFGRPGAVEFLKEVYKKYKCDAVICTGDELDFHRISRHDKDPGAKGALEEYESGLNNMKFYYKAFPKVKVCISNHTSRPYRMAAQIGIPEVFVKEYRDFMKAPKGWSWADTWEVDGVLYKHGEGFSGSTPHLTAAIKNMNSVVMGHCHTAGGVEWIASDNTRIFGMCVGCLLNQKEYAFKYAKNAPKKSIIGCGVVIDGKQPIFIAMELGARIKKIKR